MFLLPFQLLLVILVVLHRPPSSEAFTARSSSWGTRVKKQLQRSISHSVLVPQLSSESLMIMRDASCSYWFSVGDHVKVIDDVRKAGVSLYGRKGVVISTWEKCDVDPTCCCAEQVERDMAVRVSFNGAVEEDPNSGSSSTASGDSTFNHYFAEDELQKLKEEELQSIAFDGMSCTAFKLEALGMKNKAVESE